LALAPALSTTTQSDKVPNFFVVRFKMGSGCCRQHDLDQDDDAKKYAAAWLDTALQLEQRDRPDPDYMKRQSEIGPKARLVIVDWFVCMVGDPKKRLNVTAQTLFAAVDLLDRFLSKRAVGRRKLQLVACACLLLASKMEEDKHLRLDDLVWVSDCAFTHEQLRAMEEIVCKTLEHWLGRPTPLLILELMIMTGSHSTLQSSASQSQARLLLLARALTDVRSLRFLPSELARASLSPLDGSAASQFLNSYQPHEKYRAVDRVFCSQK
jgi:cyclin B